MSVTGQVLVLVLLFPAVGLMLFALTVLEERMPGTPADRSPRQAPHRAPRERARHADGGPAGQRRATVHRLAERRGRPGAAGGEARRRAG
ncbi:MAG TPA: hypothetical protein VMI33_06005 [Streptosporangiaceae bacterium]|nr:hypothetical protein [Streptosporangiaceae bacterium]